MSMHACRAAHGPLGAGGSLLSHADTDSVAGTLNLALGTVLVANSPSIEKYEKVRLTNLGTKVHESLSALDMYTLQVHGNASVCTIATHAPSTFPASLHMSSEDADMPDDAFGATR